MSTSRRADPVAAWAVDLRRRVEHGEDPAVVLDTITAWPAGERADLLGIAREAVMCADDRRRTGAVFTPPDLARRLVGWATERWELPPPWRVLDPAVGGGAFLVAAARVQVERGADLATAVAGLRGRDVDPLSVRIARAAVDALGGARGGDATDGAIRPGDGLGDRWTDRPVDLVVGNPPFLGQLASTTARDAATRVALAERFGAAASGYVDAAALFLLAALDAVRPGGRVVLVQPESVLGAAHAAAVRDEVARRADVVGLWVADAHLFAAAVDTCALVLQRRPTGARSARPAWGGGSPADVVLTAGAEVASVGTAAPPTVGAPSWSPLLARARGVPEVRLGPSAGTVADLATATAGFRQHHYALVPHLSEGVGTPVATTGMVDPLVVRWATTTARVGGRRWARPAVDLAAVAADDPAVAAWFRARLRPKVLVAPQTRVVEAAVDAEGALLPSTPLVSVEPHDGTADTAWLLAVALSAPPITAWALDRSAGTARGRHALKLSARQVLEVPLPADVERWRAVAAELADGRALVDAATDLAEACGVAADHPVVGWWRGRL